MSASYFIDGEDPSFVEFKPFKLRSLWFKGGKADTSVKDTKDQKVLADIANQRFDRYREVYLPVENAYMEEVGNFNSAGRQQQVAGAAASNTESAFAGKLNEEIQGMAGQGVNVNSGAVNNVINQNAIQKGEARGHNVNMTQQALQDQHVQGLQNIVAMGNGQSTEAIKGLGEISSYSSQQAQDDAVKSFNNTSARNQAAGTAAGMAYSGAKAIQEKGDS